MGLDTALYNIISLSRQTDRQGNKTEGQEIINHMVCSFITPYCAFLLRGWTSLHLHHTVTVQGSPSVFHPPQPYRIYHLSDRYLRSHRSRVLVVLTTLNKGSEKKHFLWCTILHFEVSSMSLMLLVFVTKGKLPHRSQ